MAALDDAVAVLTDPRNLSEVDGPPCERRFAVKQKQVIQRLREAGAGKAEARTLALQAVEKVGGLGEEDALPLPALYPGEVSQPLHHVVRVAEADLGRAGQLVEPPQMAGIHEERA